MVSKIKPTNTGIIILFLSLFMFFSVIINPCVLSAKIAGKIIGTVIEAGTQSPLPGANIIIEGTNRGTATDLNGRFIILGIPPGTYTIKASFLGYQESIKKIKVITNQGTIVDFSLEEIILKGEVVVVYGELTRGQAKSLNIQKNAANIKNVVSEEQFSVFPDNNAADAVKRIPSVTTTTDQGEGSYIQIRGMAPQHCAVTINGIKVPAPSALEDERMVGLDLIQADMFQSITVTKALTPDMDGDALGGTVNFELKGVPEKSYVKIKVSGGYNQQHSEFNKYGKDRQKYIGTAAKRFLDNKLGVLVSGNFYQSNKGSILREWHYDDDTLGDSASVNWNKWTDYDISRTRYGGIISTDYQFNPNNKLVFHYNHNTYLDNEIRRKTEFGARKGREDMEVRNRLEDQRLNSYTLGGEHQLGTMDINYTVYGIQTNETLPGRTYWRFRRSNIRLKELSSNEMFDLTGAGDDLWSDLDSLNLRYMKYQTHDTNDKNYGSAFNIKFPYAFLNQNSSAKFGAKYSSKKRTYERQEYRSSGGLTDETSTPARVYPFEDVVWDDQEAKDLGFSFKTEEDYDEENFEAKENILAAYAMTTLNFTNKLSVLVGARAEQTNNDYSYAGSYKISDLDSALSPDPKTDYVNFLPSMHLTYRLAKNTNLRLALTTGLARPSYSKLVPYNFIDESDQEIKRGNPDLKPTTSKGIDIFFEKYSSNLGLFGVGFFYKELENQIGKHSTFQEMDSVIYKIQEPFNIDFGSIWGFEIGINQRLNVLGIPFLNHFGVYANYTFTKAKSKFSNYVEADSMFVERELSFSENPPHIGNFGLTYDNSEIGFALAVIGNLRGKVIKEVGINKYTDIWYDNEFRLDISASKKIIKKLKWFIKLNNVTDQGQREVLGDPSEKYSHLYQTEQYGFYGETGFSFKF